MPSIETTILNGLPVTVEFEIQEAEPSIGIMYSYSESWYISHVKGRKIKSDDWLIKRIDAKEADRITELCDNSIS